MGVPRRRTAGAKRPQKRGERNRQRILMAAERLFARHGYSDTSIEAVAEAVDMHQPGIYYYYPSKRALYEAVVGAAVASLDDRVQELLTSSAPAEERLLAVVGTWVDAVAERPTLARLILHEAANPDTSELPRVLPEMGQRVQALIEHAFRDLGLEPHPDNVFHYESVTTGATLFFAAAIHPLLSGLEKPDVGRAMERHKRLLLRNTRDLLRAIRDEGTPLQRVGRE
jgi:AcrR family transcriptional regulator